MNIRGVVFVVALLVLAVMIPPGATAAEQKPDPDEDTSSPSLRIDWNEFKKLYDAWSAFREKELLWFRVAEQPFDDFIYRQSAQPRP